MWDLGIFLQLTKRVSFAVKLSLMRSHDSLHNDTDSAAFSFSLAIWVATKPRENEYH